MAIIRTVNVNNDSPFEIQNNVGWFNWTVPEGYVAGDDVTLTASGGALSEGAFPAAFEIMLEYDMITVNGGAVGVGPYSGSGHSYAPGVVQKDFISGNFFPNWTSQGLGQTATGGGSFYQFGGYTLIDGAGGGYAGEGMLNLNFPGDPAGFYFGPLGFIPDIATTAIQVALTTTLSPGDVVTFWFVVFVTATDVANPTRTVYGVVTDLTVTTPNAPDTVIDLATIHVGFNTGGTAVPTTQGPATYNPWRAVEAISPPLSTDHQDLYLMATALPLPNAKTQFVDIDGKPIVAGTVGHYEPGGLTPKDTWQDFARNVTNDNPLTLDARGQAAIWGAGRYRQIVKDSLGNLIWDAETATDAA